MASETGTSLVTIRLIDREADGLRVLNFAGSTLSAVRCSRKRFSSAKKEPEFQKPGVYVLLGPSEQAEYDDQVYVGEADVLANRITTHSGAKAGKEFWTEVVAFSTNDGSINEAHARWVESDLISLAGKAKRVELENSDSPNQPTLNGPDAFLAERFRDEVLQAAPLLGIKAFEVLAEEGEADGADGDGAAEQLLYLKSNGADATARDDDGEFVVFEGSVASPTEADHFEAQVPSYFKLRGELKEAGVLAEDGAGNLVMTKTYAFRSPSAAAAVLCGASKAGPASWKTEDGTTLGEVYEAQD